MSRWICGLIVSMSILIPLSGCSAMQTQGKTTGQNQQVRSSDKDKNAAQLILGSVQNAADPLDFADENALKAVLEGQWEYCPPASFEPALWISFTKDGKVHERIKNPNGTYQERNGSYQLKRWEMQLEAVPNLLQIQFPVAGGYVTTSDFLIYRKTLCDGKIVLELMQMNNGDSTFSTHFSDTCPVLERATIWQPQGTVKKGETFYGAVWKMNPTTKTVWVDDVVEGGVNIGRYESLPYQAAPQLDLNALPPQLLVNGGIWTIQTDSMGRITAMEPYIYGEYDDGYDMEMTEEEAATILSGFTEVQFYLNQGMSMFFDGDIEVISGETCIVIALGTNHSDYFVRELYYAVSPYGTVYSYDVITDTWNLLGLG
ncbi:hypothetical protein H9X85_12210 [Anaerotignum lactatifermentans]|uniref:Lipoprotein n=1 Tax=Anaerotignum lactatifermentans TaxID=160404 RepID=A0ABS2GEI0_9FIRM|nr:hypothetical protein [Anaerotignum lactatifermentans]MBM6830385.1 hypothetical protein [Anaerotignum lactatifermentans]MBM6878948.1 hypothetical protein [Anaerotignum lactatifermentans]MBM6951947.1 hypothetical protein [Anaerotignum lactatifermentans]